MSHKADSSVWCNSSNGFWNPPLYTIVQLNVHSAFRSHVQLYIILKKDFGSYSEFEYVIKHWGAEKLATQG